jgi:hypothetical protein
MAEHGLKPPKDAVELLRRYAAGERDFATLNLPGANLSGANLSDTDLSGAKLIGAFLIGVNLSGAKLIGADLSSADLQGASLSGANLNDAILRGSKLRDANFSDASLSVANRLRVILAQGIKVFLAKHRDTLLGSGVVLMIVSLLAAVPFFILGRRSVALSFSGTSATSFITLFVIGYMGRRAQALRQMESLPSAVRGVLLFRGMDKAEAVTALLEGFSKGDPDGCARALSELLAEAVYAPGELLGDPYLFRVLERVNDTATEESSVSDRWLATGVAFAALVAAGGPIVGAVGAAVGWTPLIVGVVGAAGLVLGVLIMLLTVIMARQKSRWKIVQGKVARLLGVLSEASPKAGRRMRIAIQGGRVSGEVEEYEQEGEEPLEKVRKARVV